MRPLCTDIGNALPSLEIIPLKIGSFFVFPQLLKGRKVVHLKTGSCETQISHSITGEMPPTKFLRTITLSLIVYTSLNEVKRIVRIKYPSSIDSPCTSVYPTFGASYVLELGLGMRS